MAPLGYFTTGPGAAAAAAASASPAATNLGLSTNPVGGGADATAGYQGWYATWLQHQQETAVTAAEAGANNGDDGCLLATATTGGAVPTSKVPQTYSRVEIKREAQCIADIATAMHRKEKWYVVRAQTSCDVWILPSTDYHELSCHELPGSWLPSLMVMKVQQQQQVASIASAAQASAAANGAAEMKKTPADTVAPLLSRAAHERLKLQSKIAAGNSPKNASPNRR